MALYKDAGHVAKSDSTEFDSLHKPGSVTPHSAIYRCEGCGVEIVSEKGKVMPPTHANIARGHAILWRMIVYAVEKQG